MRLFDYVLKYSKFISIFLHKAICNYKIKKNNKEIEKKMSPVSSLILKNIQT